VKHSVLMVSSEATPWAKTGGLADVVGALPAALAAHGHPVAVVIPRYMDAATAPASLVYENLWIPVGSRYYNTSIWELRTESVITYFVDQPELFDRPGLYGDHHGDFPDNHIRFALLSKAALEISRLLFQTDIFHCHDWQASLLPVFLQEMVDPYFLRAKTLLTIHNLGYQGLFDPAALRDLGLPANLFHSDAMEFWGKVNLLKGGIVFADALTTVSKRYAEEIQTREYGFGLDGLLVKRRASLHGILNGVDYSQWSPESDPLIAVRYSAQDLSGKRACKLELMREMELPDDAMDRPLVGIVSRFAGQKGFDLLRDVIAGFFDQDVSLVVLGNGEQIWEDFFRDLPASFPGRAAVRIGYDDTLAHRIEAGSDMFLMPSRYEPCGLNQIYSLRYGTVPVVRATGGLDDTITEIPVSEATGFKFHDYNGKALLDAIRRARATWQNQEIWAAMMARGMQKDFSWAASAGEYSRLYSELASFGASGDSNY
jgi:starch synthase